MEIKLWGRRSGTTVTQHKRHNAYLWHCPHFSVTSSGSNSWSWFPVLSFKTKPLLLQRQTQTVILGSSYRYLSTQWMAWITYEALCIHTHTLKKKNAKSHPGMDWLFITLLYPTLVMITHPIFPCRFSRKSAISAVVPTYHYPAIALQSVFYSMQWATEWCKNIKDYCQ